MKIKKKYIPKRSRLLLTVLSVFILTALSTVLYPTISCLANELSDGNTITAYTENVDTLTEEDKNTYFNEAREYNNKLTNLVSSESFINYDGINDNYESILNIDNGIMGSVEIPKLNIELPIYHGTSEEVLSEGVGHMSNTSFPIGEKNTHAVISAHTAYPGKTFFNDLPKLEEGDIFYITILSNKFTYRVCEKNIVDPDDTSKLQIVDGKDYVSLLTCYPYAVNTHRLIVTGERIASDEATADSALVEQAGDVTSISRYLPLIIAIPILILTIIVMIVIMIITHIRNKKALNRPL